MKITKSILISTVCLAYTPCVHAQQSDSTQDSNANAAQNYSEIVVTAQRRNQRLQDVPVAVSVTSGETIAEANIGTLEQLSVRLPAVKLTQTGASDQLHIRGTGSGLNGGFEQSVATFVDGLYRGRARSSRSALFDVERVEVLKGPQTTFFGNNAIAGAFNITTRKPRDEFGFNVSASFAPSDDEYNVQAGVDIPLAENLALRLAGQASGMDGYVFNVNLAQDEPRIRSWIGRGTLRWEPTDNFETTLRIDRGRNRDTGTYSGEILNCPTPAEFGAVTGTCAAYLALRGPDADDELNLRSDTGASLFNNDFTEIGWSNTIFVGEHTINLLTGFYHHSNIANSQIIPTPVPGVFGAASGLPVTQDEDLDQFSQEIRLSSPTGGRVEYMLGAYYSDADLKYDSYIGFFFAPFANFVQPNFPANVPVTSEGITRQKDRTLSAFGSATFNVTDKLSLSGALRYTSVRKRAERTRELGVSDGSPFFNNFVAGPAIGQQILSNILGVDLAGFPIASRTDDAWMPSATVQYKINSDVNAYASYTRGFKAGGFSVLTADTFDPENVDAFEIGMKGIFFDRRLTLNIAAFLSNFSDLQEASQILIPGGTPISVIGNSAKSRAQGIEIGGNLKLADGVYLNTDIAYLRSRYIEYPDGPCTVLASLTPNCVQDLAGARRAFSPEWSGNVNLSIEKPIGNLLLKIDPVLAFSSSFLQQSFNDPQFSQSGYAKIDLRIALESEDSGWEVAVIGRNLTDKITASFRNVVPTSPGAVFALPERGRSIAIQASFSM